MGPPDASPGGRKEEVEGTAQAREEGARQGATLSCCHMAMVDDMRFVVVYVGPFHTVIWQCLSQSGAIFNARSLICVVVYIGPFHTVTWQCLSQCAMLTALLTTMCHVWWYI